MHLGLAPDTFGGITVVDFSRLLPGPFCTQLLADLGARVIKVEPVEGGDYARWYPPLVDHSDVGFGAFFDAVNRGKQSVAVDLKKPEGVAFAKKLLQRADVVVEGFRPGVLDRLGLSREVMRDANPQMVVCRISGFGQDGPIAGRAGHDLTYLARSGLLSLQGPADAPPAVLGLQSADLAGGALYAAFAIAAALFRRTQKFQGADIDVSMTEGVTSLLGPAFSEARARQTPAPRGRDVLTGGIPCYRCYTTADGRYIAVGALEPHFWAGFCALIGRDDLATSGMVTGPEAQAVAAAVGEAVAARPFAEWVDVLSRADVCVEPVLTLDEVVRDAQTLARRSFDPTGLPLPPTSAGSLTQSPRLGNATRAVARELGLDDAAVESLVAQRVLRTCGDQA